MRETTVPVCIADDAAAKVEELGYRREMEQMIEHVLQTGRGLKEVRVTLADDHPEYHGPEVIVWAIRDLPPEGVEADRTDWDWWYWMAENLPTDPGAHIGLWSTFGEPYGR